MAYQVVTSKFIENDLKKSLKEKCKFLNYIFTHMGALKLGTLHL